MRTFEFTAARDGDLFGADYVTGTLEEAEALAVADINEAWGQSYADYDEMGGDCDGNGMIEHPAVMAERQPKDVVDAHRRLYEGLRDMVEGERIGEGDIPNDHAWLLDALDRVAGAEDAIRPDAPATN